jgi:beta-N-acetylhexosaminidase
MGAIINHYDIYTVIHQILIADVDLALICHKGPNIEKAFNEIKKNIIEDDLIREKNIASLNRIMTHKNKFLKNIFQETKS